jgi:hypothetical protein
MDASAQGAKCVCACRPTLPTGLPSRAQARACARRGRRCFCRPATLAGDTGDETFGHLRRSVELFPPFREQARSDDDFATVRDDPRFEEALR